MVPGTHARGVKGEIIGHYQRCHGHDLGILQMSLSMHGMLRIQDNTGVRVRVRLGFGIWIGRDRVRVWGEKAQSKGRREKGGE